MNRRDFIKNAISTASALVLTPVLKMLPAPKPEYYIGIDVGYGESITAITRASIRRAEITMTNYLLIEDALYVRGDV